MAQQRRVPLPNGLSKSLQAVIDHLPRKYHADLTYALGETSRTAINVAVDKVYDRAFNQGYKAGLAEQARGTKKKRGRPRKWDEPKIAEMRALYRKTGSWARVSRKVFGTDTQAAQCRLLVKYWQKKDRASGYLSRYNFLRDGPTEEHRGGERKIP